MNRTMKHLLREQTTTAVLLTVLFTFLLPPAVCGHVVTDVADICKRMDEEIAQWPERVALRQVRIDSLVAQLYQEKGSAREQFDLCSAIVDEYSSFQNDSALFFCKMLKEIAPWTEDPSRIALATVKKARQAVKSGMYEAALTYLAAADTTVMGKEVLTEYWRVYHFAYVEMSAYCYIWDKRQEYLKEEARCRQQLLALLTEHSAEWYLYKAYDALLSDHYEEARRLSDQCMALTPRYGELYRTAAFHRRFICESLDKPDEAVYWQAECAISELRQGLTDQIGVWSLAEKMGNSDLDRSYAYVRFAWDAVSRFSEKNVRSWQLTPVLSSIEHQYQTEHARLSNIIMTGAVILAALTLLLAVLLLYANRQRKRLSVAHRSMQEGNRKLKEANSLLSDVNRVKEEYIVRLLEYNSEFIDAKEEERRTESKLLRNGKMKELALLLNAAEKSNQELGLLLARFDEIFLGLYPTFVEDFNALLREEGQLKTSKSGHLNTPLRIFALLRLGIDHTADVSKILHCSPQTVYNYRNNLRNSYRFNRDDFDDAVRSIGIPSLVDV